MRRGEARRGEEVAFLSGRKEQFAGRVCCARTPRDRSSSITSDLAGRERERERRSGSERFSAQEWRGEVSRISLSRETDRFTTSSSPTDLLGMTRFVCPRWMRGCSIDRPLSTTLATLLLWLVTVEVWNGFRDRGIPMD